MADDLDTLAAQFGGSSSSDGLDALAEKYGGRPGKPKGNPWSGVVDAAVNAASSMVAGPVSNAAVLLSMGPKMLGLIEGDPAAIKERVQRALTVEPATETGEQYASSNLNPIVAVGKAVDWAGRKASDWLRDPSKGEDATQNMAANAIKSGIEEGIGLLGVKGGAKARASMIPAKQAAADLAKETGAATDAVRAASQEAGYITTPERGAQSLVAGVGGRNRTNDIISVQNELNATRRLGEEVGIPNGQPLTPEVLEAATAAPLSKYRALEQKAGPQIEVTPDSGVPEKIKALAEEKRAAAKRDNTAEANASAHLVEHFEQQMALRFTDSKSSPSVQGTINRQLGEQPGLRINNLLEQVSGEQPHSYTGSQPLTDWRDMRWQKEILPEPNDFIPVSVSIMPRLDTKWVIGQISDLRKNAKDSYRRGDNRLGETNMEIANTLEDLLEHNIGARAGPEALAEFRDARKTLAKIYLLDRVTNSATGLVDLKKLGAVSDSTAYKGVLDGESKLAADFAKTFHEAAKPGRSASVGGHLTNWDLMWGLGGMLSGHPVAMALGATKIGAGVAAPLAAGRGLLQNKAPKYEVGKLAQSTPPLLESLGVTAMDHDNISLRDLLR